MWQIYETAWPSCRTALLKYQHEDQRLCIYNTNNLIKCVTAFNTAGLRECKAGRHVAAELCERAWSLKWTQGAVHRVHRRIHKHGAVKWVRRETLDVRALQFCEHGAFRRVPAHPPTHPPEPTLCLFVSTQGAIHITLSSFLMSTLHTLSNKKNNHRPQSNILDSSHDKQSPFYIHNTHHHHNRCARRLTLWCQRFQKRALFRVYT